MKKLFSATILFAICFAPQLEAQLTGSNPNQNPASAAGITQAAPLDTEPTVTKFKKTVVFLETDCLTDNPAGGKMIVPHLGTGFLVTHHDPKFPSIAGFNYLITNRHVAKPGIEDGVPCQVVDYKVRLNLKNAATDGSLSEVASLGPGVPWVFPSDRSVDLAIVPFGIDPAKYVFLNFPTALFLTADEAKQNHVVEGDSVLFTGLFVQFLGQVKLEPIVREGKIAMIPDDPIPTTLRFLGNIYLVDAHVFGGNSGSPMLVNLSGQRDNGLMAGFNYHLLGLISGYMQETTDFKLQAVASYAGTVVANSGVAIVVPAQQILDLLDSEDLQKVRQQAASKLPAPKAP